MKHPKHHAAALLGSALAAATVAWLGCLDAGAAPQPRTTTTSCTACHSDASLFDEDHVGIVTRFHDDIHGELGLSCHDCHGGNPSPELSDDPGGAMDPGFGPNPYRGAPAPAEVPSFCGRCHSDPLYMRRFRPDARVDQEREYYTSQHGISLARGDTKVATCISCHGTHGIRRPSSPASSVYPTQVAETCSGCHSDPQYMAGYTLDNGRPLPIDQYSRWRQSAHAHGLLVNEDISAPTCNDCHGNHGATPPGVESVAFVCGRCHGRQADLFRGSSKAEGLRHHESYLADAGPDGCAACHDSPTLIEAAERFHAFTECTTCHGSHGVVRATTAMLAPLPDTPCSFCHEPPESAADQIVEQRALIRRYSEKRDGLLAEAAEAGLDGEDRFNWLVDQLRTMPEHTIPAADGGPGEFRSEFRNLYSKFRIGKTYFTHDDPAGEGEVRADLVRCDDCHEPGSHGYETSASFLNAMRELTSLTAGAQRMLLAARRGGVETREAASSVDHAVNAQVELEVLVHSFVAENQFAEKHDEGMEHALEAAALSRDGLDHLAFRRRGLAISLVFIVLVLIALGLKIRRLPPVDPVTGRTDPPGPSTARGGARHPRHAPGDRKPRDSV